MLFNPRQNNIQAHVIETWWQRLGPDGLVCLGVGDPPRCVFCRQDKVDVESFIRHQHDEHLFFCPHPFTKAHRVKENAVPCRALWADLDAADPAKLGELEPTFAFESSPKRYAGLWLLDRVPSVGLNQRLSYHVGADKGGWCFTKLLRLPGSRNQKYKPPPRALVLWDDGPEHCVDELERLLPPLKVNTPSAHRGGVGISFNLPKRVSYIQRLQTAEAICQEYRLDRNLSHELMHGQPRGEDRSNALWKFANELHEAGVPADDAYVVLRGSAWSRARTDDVERVIGKIWGRS